MKYLQQFISFLKRKKTYVIMSAVFLVIVFSAIYFFAIRGNNAAPTNTNAGAAATKGNISVTVTGTGTVLPIEEKEITPYVTAAVKKLYAKTGDYVNKGELIAELESDSLELQLKKAQLELEKAKYSLDEVATQTTKATLKAPFAGRITSLEVKAGDEVNKNAVLAVLQNDSQLVFDMPVSGEAAAKIKANQLVKVFIVDKGDNVDGKVISNDGQTIKGYDGQARSNVKVGIPVKGNLSPGTLVFGSITIDGKEIDALATSTLEWLGDTQIKADIAGKLTGFSVKKGQVVKAGQTLFTIKDDTAASEEKNLQIAYEQARLNLEDLENQTEDLKVFAEISGVISGMDITEGDEFSGELGSRTTTDSTSAQDEKTFGKIINSKLMSISFPVDEVDITKVKLGQGATVEIDALPGKSFKGEVTEIAEEGTVNNNVSSFDVTINMQNTDKLLKSGMTANITIITNHKENTLLIPIEALQQSPRGNFVILDSSPEEQQAKPSRGMNQGARRQVEVGLTNESFAEILSGLKEGEKVVLPELAASTQTNQQRPGGPMGGGMGGGIRVQGGGRPR